MQGYFRASRTCLSSPYVGTFRWTPIVPSRLLCFDLCGLLYLYQVTEVLMSCYGMIFGLLITLVELDNSWLIAHMAFMDSWIVRGFCISLCGSTQLPLPLLVPLPLALPLPHPHSDGEFRDWRQRRPARYPVRT